MAKSSTLPKNQPVSDFMLLKYKADLLYHKKEFTEAAAVYSKVSVLFLPSQFFFLLAAE